MTAKMSRPVSHLGLLSVPWHNLSFGSHAFRISAPKYGIPYRLTFCSLKHSLHLKTHYFQSAYPAHQRPSPMCPDSLLRLWHYINHLLTYLLQMKSCYYNTALRMRCNKLMISRYYKCSMCTIHTPEYVCPQNRKNTPAVMAYQSCRTTAELTQQ